MTSEVKKYTINEPWLNTSCGLGEGPFWEESNNALRFVDIINKKLFFADLSKGESSLKEHQLDFSIGITADIEMIRADQIETAYERMLKGDVKYRFVIDIASIGA